MDELHPRFGTLTDAQRTRLDYYMSRYPCVRVVHLANGAIRLYGTSSMRSARVLATERVEP